MERKSLQVGQFAEQSRRYEQADVLAFAQLTGDDNPVHVDAEAAAKGRFGQRLVHGMLVASGIATLLGTRLPGVGSVYVSQSLRFVAPVFFGDEITARVEVVKIREDKPFVTLATTCRKQDGSLVIDGEAVIYTP